MDDSFGKDSSDLSQQVLGTPKHVQAKDGSNSGMFQQGSCSSSHSQKGMDSLSHPQPDCADTVSRQPGELDSSVEAVTPSKPTKKTPHSEPGWLESLNHYFVELIVEGCSAMTRRAVENNETLQVSIWCDIMSF